MRQLLIPRYGPPEVLTIREVPEPVPGPGSVRIRVEAAGVNFSDLMARQGLYPDAPKPPCVVGYEVSGTVDAVGPGVESPRVGAPVVAITRFGGQSESVVVPAAFAFPRPDRWSAVVGAAFPVVYLTAHHLLVRVAAARAGETVLVQAAAGGVGLAVAELARIFGLRVIGLASASKHAVLRDYQVEPVDRLDPDWAQTVRRLAPSGVDIVLDSVGGASSRRGFELLAPVGRLVCFGVSELAPGQRRNPLSVVARVLLFPRFGPLALMNGNRAVAGVNLGRLWTSEPVIRPQVEALLGYARDGRITPRVDRTFALSDAARAHHYIHARKNVGKVVLTLA